MDTKNKNTKNNEDKKELSTSLDNFLEENEKECVGEECLMKE